MKFSMEAILCTYNGCNYVDAQLESIVLQRTPVDKASIYDDASTDGTVARIETFLARCPGNQRRRFAITVNPVKVGYAANFCRAIANATQDLLFLCDQDDVWEVDKVGVMVALLAERADDMICSDDPVIDELGHRISKTSVLRSYRLSPRQIREFGDIAFERLVRCNYVNGAAVAIRRLAAQSALPLPCDMPHDYWLALWCSLHGGLSMTPRRLYRYRQHRSNAIGIGVSRWLYNWLGVWRHHSAPRERELRIWTAVTDRIVDLRCPTRAELARQKLEWLLSVVALDGGSIRRAIRILRSALSGKYTRFAPPGAFARDLISLFR